MVKTAIALLSLTAVAAFTGQPLRTPARNVVPLFMGGGSGYATSLEGKKERVATVKKLLDKSEMIFSIPAGSMTVPQSQKLRNSLPPSTTMMVIKNKLLARAVEGTQYEPATSLLKGPNTWFFVEDDISGTLTAYNAFIKEFNKKESHPLLGGVVDGQVYDGTGVDAIGKLPSKQELYAKIAGSIKAVPTKVARVIKAPGNKLARAIKLATDENNKA